MKSFPAGLPGLDVSGTTPPRRPGMPALLSALFCSVLLVACSEGDSERVATGEVPSLDGTTGDGGTGTGSGGSDTGVDGTAGGDSTDGGTTGNATTGSGTEAGDTTGGDTAGDGEPPETRVPASGPPDNLPSSLAPRADDLFPAFDPYQSDGYTAQEDVLRVDVRTVPGTGPCVEADQSGCTLADVLGDIDNDDDFKVTLPIHFSASDFPDDGAASNATLRQRGNSARAAPQKSFRIELDDKDALWRGERKLFLNKHPFENTRVRNRLSMELMRDIPYLTSLRTQFVNLWIDDGNGAADQGLFTHVEAPGSRWLKRRGFDKDDSLYKASFFRFFSDERNALRTDEEGKALDKDQFESLLEIEAGDDHSALGRMLDALHDPAVDFETVLDRHFNRNNVIVWLATNILLHQTDGVTHNYLMHNPVGTDRFYFVPWDYDGTLFSEPELDPAATDNNALAQRQFYGYARNVNNAFITRFLQLPGMHGQIVDVAEWLVANYLDPASVDAKALAMVATVEPFRARLPDSAHFIEGYRPTDGSQFSGTITDNLEALRTRFSVPLAPTLQAPVRQGTQWRFAWTPGFEVTGNVLEYDLQISNSLTFAPADIVVALTGIADAAGLVEATVNASAIPAGVHYVRVTARAQNDPARYWQVPTNVVRQDDGQTWFGMVPFGGP